ncbi:hypothetical protein H4219_004535 [Mycoemilia scoparia]|uniref:Uncharacterized protein n=1 Tax=Mycoemilia scoparia TaxID=417184 RepID=A0A9W8DR01_9FUNG|nr:hypothetical protein H4219_004535 [Mycoemilia scoparia]
MLPPPIPSHELNITTRTDVYSTWSVNTEKFGLDDLLDYFGQLSTINKNLNSGVLKMLSDNWETLAGIIGEAFSDINDGYPQIYDSMTKQLGNTEVPKTYDPEWIAKLGDLDPVVKKAFGIDELISGLDEYTSVFDEIRNEIDYENRINAGGSATKSGEEESSRKSNDHDDDEGRGTNSRGIINNTLFVSLAFAVIVCTMLF